MTDGEFGFVECPKGDNHNVVPGIEQNRIIFEGRSYLSLWGQSGRATVPRIFTGLRTLITYDNRCTSAMYFC
jgi:hypothetical protein